MTGRRTVEDNGLIVSVVIPVYNEGATIEPTVAALAQHVPGPFEVIVVYDHDEDTTLPVLRQLADSYPNMRWAKNDVFPGPSGALRTGFGRARAQRVLVVMADLSDDLTQIPELLRLVPEHADVACPSRYCRGGAQQLDAPLKVGLPRAAGWLLRLLTGLGTLDPTNSFKLYSSDVLDAFALTSVASFSVTLEIVAKAHCLGYRIVEIPTVWRDRQHGTSHFRLGQALVAYLPWFGVALMRNRLFRLPRRWVGAWIGVPASLAQVPEQTVGRA